MDHSGIQIYKQNPFYWQFNGKPTLLLGGSLEDNLFQINNLKAHLELLHSMGGNYVRCTMSSRDEGDVKPYLKNAEGLFDLDQFNPEYWLKFENLLRWSEELAIIVQIEIWATYDFYWGASNWASNPFNPKLNTNYTSKESQLPEAINHPAQTAVNPFFLSVPSLQDNQFLRVYQQRFVDKLLSISLAYSNVLYCIDNETLVPHPWGKYWADYIHTQAKTRNKNIYVTEMWDYWDPSLGEVEGTLAQHPSLGDWFADHTNPDLHKQANFSYTFNDPDTYQFVDISNHNAQKGETHARTGAWVREQMLKSGKIRPINNVKIYGGDMENIWAGNRIDGKERFCRNIFMGHASARFHRPIFGMGLDGEAQSFITSMRMLTNAVDFFSFEPANYLFGNRAANAVYCLANQNHEYLLYFPASGQISFRVAVGQYEVKQLHIPSATWAESEIVTLPGQIKTKSDAQWGMIVRRIDD